MQGLLGVSDCNEVFENQHLLNIVASIFSTASKCVNKKAVNYALLLTNAVRDGGLREDTIKIFSNLVHPRTSQKYDKQVLSKDWDKPLEQALSIEREYMQKLTAAFEKKRLIQDQNTDQENSKGNNYY